MSDPTDQCGVFFEGDDIVEDLRTYLLSVTAAALLCGIVRGLGKSRVPAIAAGLFLVITVLGPLANWNGNWPAEDWSISQDGQKVAEEGRQLAQQAMADSIKEETGAYILEKAKAIHADIQVKVEVSDDTIPLPVGVQISGSVTPYAKKQLETFLEDELGISKENQLWI